MRFRTPFFVVLCSTFPAVARAELSCRDIFNEPIEVTAAEVLAIVPPKEIPFRKFIEGQQKLVDELINSDAPKEQIVEVSDNAVAYFSERLKSLGYDQKIVELKDVDGIPRKAIQVLGGPGTIGRLGLKMNADNKDSPFNHETLLYDPYLLFTKRLKLAAYIPPKSDLPSRGIRLPHDMVVSPQGIGLEAVRHEAGHMVEQYMRDQGMDNGLVGYIGALDTGVEGYNNGYHVGENRQYVNSANTAAKEMKRQESIAADSSLAPDVRENAAASAKKLSLLTKRRIEQARKFFADTSQTYNRALARIKDASDKEILEMVAAKYGMPMKNHLPVGISLFDSKNAFERAMVVYIPEKQNQSASEIRAALRKSLGKTGTKLKGLQKTISNLSSEHHRMNLEIGKGGDTLRDSLKTWKPVKGEKIVLNFAHGVRDGIVGETTPTEIFISWPSGERTFHGKLNRESGKFQGINGK